MAGQAYRIFVEDGTGAIDSTPRIIDQGEQAHRKKKYRVINSSKNVLRYADTYKQRKTRLCPYRSSWQRLGPACRLRRRRPWCSQCKCSLPNFSGHPQAYLRTFPRMLTFPAPARLMADPQKRRSQRVRRHNKDPKPQALSLLLARSCSHLVQD